MKSSIITLSLLATISLFTNVVQAQESEISCSLNSSNLTSNKQSKQQNFYQPSNSSGSAEIALAQHLKKIKAKMYGGFRCPRCHNQQEKFGKQAWNNINYVECDPKGRNSRPDLCQKANVQGYPTWEIKGKTYAGQMSLEELATISGYRGNRNFKN